ncbi:hypothetical protein M3Y99_00541400 [Aphelenchoides fujianensis]|nr:hypothetical protein M3Y99_00541400 [Aphelenchoides fujianensis]
MMGWMADRLYKPVSRFLIERYMGDFLDRNITDDDIHVELKKGLLALENIKLNHIDSLVQSLGVIRVIQGYMGKISISIPWRDLAGESTVITLNDLELTVTPLQKMDMTNAQEIVSTLVDSMSSQADMARSMIEQEQQATSERSDESIEKLAQAFDQFISKIKIVFVNTHIRLESDTDLGTALEFKIDRMVFVDEKLEAVEQQQGTSTVTTQPTSLFSPTDLSKLLHIEGLRIYTDIWTRDSESMNSSQDLGSSDSCKSGTNGTEQSMVSSSFQSCYSSFNESRRTTAASSSESNGLAPREVQIAQIFGEKSTIKLQINNAALGNSASGFNKKFAIKLEFGGPAFAFLTPTQFALISDLLSRLSPSASVEVGGGLPMRPEHFDAVHSESLKHAMGGGMDGLGDLVDPRFAPSSAPSSNSLHQHFANNPTDTFFEIPGRGHHTIHGSSSFSAQQRRSASVCTSGATPFTNVPLDSQAGCDHRRHGSGSAATGSYGSSGGDSDSLTERGTQHGSNLTLTEKRPDLLNFEVKLPAFLLVITHDDPLSVDEIRAAGGANATNGGQAMNVADIRAQIDQLEERAVAFFRQAERHVLVSAKPLASQFERDACARLYPHDHVRLVARKANMTLHSEFNAGRNVYDFKLNCYEADVCEFLVGAAVVRREHDGHYSTAASSQHFDIFNFDLQTDGGKRKSKRAAADEDDHLDGVRTSMVPDLLFEIQNRERESQHRAQLRLGACRTHLDLSMVDRLHNLLQLRPFMPIFAASTTAGASAGLTRLLNAADLNQTLTSEPHALDGLLDNEQLLYPSGGAFAGLADSALSAAAPQPTTFAFQLQCPKWTVDLRIPRADYSAQAPTFRCKNLHDELLRLHFTDARLEVDAFEPATIDKQGRVTIKCASLSGDFRSTADGAKAVGAEFFHATSRAAGGEGVKIGVNYDTRNKELRLSTNAPRSSAGDFLATRSMQESLYFFRSPAEDQMEGPFSKSNRYFDGERLISAGSRKELQEFAADCQKNAVVNIAVDVSSLNLHLPSHDFLELLYNRFANDLALWSLRAPVFNQNQRDAQLMSTLVPLGGESLLGGVAQPDVFAECRGDAMSCSMYVDQSRGDAEADEPAGGSHQLALSVRAEECRCLMQTTVSPQMKTDEQLVPDDDFNAQLLVELSRGQFFLVHAFNSVPSLDYMFVSAARTRLMHRNLLNDAVAMNADVWDAAFCANLQRADLQAEPNAEDYAPPADPFAAPQRNTSGGTPTDEDALAVGLKIHSSEESRKITIAVALRNTLLHLRPVVNPAHHWSQQFVSFFSLVDYEVPGYVWPKMELDAHVQLQNVALGYDHCLVLPESPMIVRFVIGSCHLSARYEQIRCYTNLNCLFESTRLYVAKRPPPSPPQVRFAPTGASASPSAPRRQPTSRTASELQARPRFVKALEINLVHVKLEAELPEDPSVQPSISIQSCNNEITLWTCADTIIELVRIYDEFQCSEVGRALRRLSTQQQAAVAPTPAPSAVSPFESEPIPQVPESVSSAANLAAMGGGEGGFGHSSSSSQPLLRTRTSTSSLGSVSNAPGAAKTLTPKAQEKLKSELSSAMREDVGVPAASSSQRPQPLAEEAGVRRAPLVQRENSDEEFEMLDEIPGSGITNAAGDPKVRLLDKTEDGEPLGFVMVSDHLPHPSEEPTTEIKLPAGHPAPLWQLVVKDCAIRVLLYSGADFADSLPELKPRSMWNDARDSRECMKEGSEGGVYRDHTVCVEVKVTHMSFVHKCFGPTAPTRSLVQFTVGNVEILDHLLVSQIDKFLYQYVDSVMPPRLHTPLFSLKMIEDPRNDRKLKITLLPLRFNLDQDTVEFLLDFAAQCGREVKLTVEEVADDAPDAVMEVGGGEEDEEERAEPPLPAAANEPPAFPSAAPLVAESSGVNFHLEEPTVVFRKETDELKIRDLDIEEAERADREERDAEERETAELGEQLRRQPAPEDEEDDDVALESNPFGGLYDPFDESDVNFDHQEVDEEEDVFTLPLNQPAAPPQPPSRSGSLRDSRTSLHSMTAASPLKQRRPSAQSAGPSAAPPAGLVDDPFGLEAAPFGGIGAPLRASSSTASVADSTCTSATSATQRLLRVQTREPFFKEVIFSPQCTILFDYVPKRMNSDHGPFVGFLVSVVDMKRSQLVLKELNNQRGVLGYRKLSEYMRSEWESDITQQWSNLLTSYGPIQSLVEIFRGSRDLFYYPMSEMQRPDGRLVRGLQRGASSFTKSAAIAAIDAGQQVFGFVQNISEFGVDVMTSESESRRRQNVAFVHRGDQPTDIREGMHRAGLTVYGGFEDIRRSWQTAAQESRAQYAENPHAAANWGGGRALWRQVIPTILKPFVFVPQAANQALGGLRSQIRPEESHEEREKWRQPSRRQQRAAGPHAARPAAKR